MGLKADPARIAELRRRGLSNGEIANALSISTRTVIRMVNRANGQRIGTVPYGFDLADDRNTLVSNESEQAVIVDVKAMRARGMKLKQIAADLTARKGPTKTGRSERWSHQSVARLVKRIR